MKVVAWVLGALVGMLAFGFVLGSVGLLVGREWGFGLFVGALVGLVVAIEQQSGPHREGESLDDFERRQRRLTRLNRTIYLLIGSVVTAGLTVVGWFIWAMNSWADNK